MDQAVKVKARIGLVAVLILGAALRFWHIETGLPYRIGPDEPVIAERAIHIMRTGNFHPRFFDYPGLYIYFQVIVGCVVFVAGAMAGLWRSVNQFYPEHLFAWTRILNAVIGTLTIAVVYRAGLRWGHWVALTSAAILAVWPNHVRESHFALTDVPLTLFIASTFVLSLRAYESGRWPWFLLAGMTSGLAAATKYNGAYVLVLPLVAAAVVDAQKNSIRLAYASSAVMASVIAFLGTAPYTVIDLPAFLNGFGALSAYYRHRPFVEGARIYVGHLHVAIGWIGVSALVGGMIWGTARAVRNHDLRRWAIVAVFPLIYFFSVATKQLIFGRYLLPALPFFCVIMGLVIVDAVTWLWHLHQPIWVRRLIVVGTCLLVLFPVARAGVAWPLEYGRRTTQDVAYEQIREIIPEGSGVVVERSVLRLPDTLYKEVHVNSLVGRSLQQYVARQITFVVASSDVFSMPGHCLPAIEPTPSMSGPRIIICRLDAPIQ